MSLTPEDLLLLQDKNVHGFTKAMLKRWGIEKPTKGWRTRLLIENGVPLNLPTIQATHLEVPDFIQPILQSVGLDRWNELSAGNQRVISQWIAEAVRIHNQKSPSSDTSSSGRREGSLPGFTH